MNNAPLRESAMIHSGPNDRAWHHRLHFWRMGLFGGVSAIPLSFLVSLSTIWLTDYGCLPMHMGTMAWMMSPYALKIFLAPLVQMTSFGRLGKRYGHYVVWIVLAQWTIAVCIIGISFLRPLTHWYTTLGLCLVIALFGAIQDCALEGYRIHSTSESNQSQVAGMNATGYRIGMWATSYGALVLAHHYDWPLALHGMAGFLVVCGLLCIVRLPQPRLWPENISVRQYGTLLKQVWGFFTKTYYFSSVIGMIAAHKLGDIALRSLWSHYWIKSGYTKQALANTDKGLGILATILGIQIGVYWINRYHIASAFRLWAMLQGAMAFLFVVHAYEGHQHALLFFTCVWLNHLVGGIGNVTLLTYISNLCKTKDQKDSLHYAMISSMGSLGRTLVSHGACLVAASVSWPIFFAISGLLCAPAWFLARTARPFQKRPPTPVED